MFIVYCSLNSVMRRLFFSGRNKKKPEAEGAQTAETAEDTEKTENGNNNGTDQ